MSGTMTFEEFINEYGPEHSHSWDMKRDLRAMMDHNQAELKAENERLRRALKPMIEGTRWITNEQVDAAREALSGGK